MSNYQNLRFAIVEFVKEMLAAGSVIDADMAAIRLSSRYPQSGMTLDQIVETIQRAALDKGAALIRDHLASNQPDPPPKP